MKDFKVKYTCIRCGMGRVFFDNQEAVDHLRKEHWEVSGYKRRYQYYPDFDQVFKTEEL